MFNNITEEMLSELNSTDLERFKYIKTTIEKGELTPPLVIRRFSDLAFSFAQKSLREDKVVSIAKPLAEVFNNYLDSSLISIDTKENMKQLIGETKLDFIYASGNHDITSLRLAPYLMARGL
ncbi:hypothetical protein IKF27_01195 [Candidatus Saccharibacteria bacterium]|nr:hypothetical protein [Candidatus Saccharibacteria bacterium]